MADKKNASHWPITLTNSAAALVSIILPLILARILPPDAVGRYSIFFLYVTLAPNLLLTSGLTNGLYHWTGKYPEAKAEVRQSWSLTVAMAIVICTLGAVWAYWANPTLQISRKDLILVILSTPFSVALSFIEDLMIARGDIWKGAWYGSASNIARTSSILLAAWWTRNLEIIFWVFLIGTVIRAGVGWYLVRQWDEIVWLFSWKKAKNVLGYAFPVTIAALAGLSLQHVDQMILSFRLEPSKFAFYAMGCLSVPPLEIFETAVNRVLIPRLSRAFNHGQTEEAAGLFAEGVSELFRFLLPASLGLMIYAEPIIKILFTDRYIAATGYLRIYALTYLIMSFSSSVVARARGDSKWILRTSVIFAILSTAATWMAAGRWGAMGALIAVVGNQFLIRVYSLPYLKSCFKGPFSHIFPLQEILLQTGIAAVAAGGVISMRPLFADPRLWFAVTGPLFTVVYFAATYGLYRRRLGNDLGPIHVIELAQTLGFGGSERIVYQLAQGLHQHEQFNVLVATYDEPEGAPSWAPQFKEAGIPLVQWRKRKGFSFQSVARLVQIVYMEQTRVIHAHDIGPLIYGSLAKVFSLNHARLVLTVHTLKDIKESAKHKAYYRFFLRFPDRIIAVSSDIKAGLEELGINPKRIEVIPNGAAFSYFPLHAKDPIETLALRKILAPSLSADIYTSRWLLCLARLHPGKGQDVILDIWAALPKDVRAQFALFFVGQETHSGYQETLRKRIKSLPDSDRIILAGPSDRPEDWIQSVDVFISGSLLEGMPLAPLEAAGSGLPTLLSEIEGHRFLEPWATYFDPQKPEEGAARLREILDVMRQGGKKEFYAKSWKAAASVRERWGVPAMTNSYAAAFKTT